jgi:hypothetical protein
MDMDFKKLRLGLEDRGLGVNEFAILLAAEGIPFASKTKLNECWRDVDPVPLKDDVAPRVWSLWEELNEMCFSFLPYPLDVSDGSRTHTSLELFRGMKVLQGTEGK